MNIDDIIRRRENYKDIVSSIKEELSGITLREEYASRPVGLLEGYYSPCSYDLYVGGTKRGKLSKSKPATGLVYYFDDNNVLRKIKHLVDGNDNMTIYYEYSGEERFGYVIDSIGDSLTSMTYHRKEDGKTAETMEISVFRNIMIKREEYLYKEDKLIKIKFTQEVADLAGRPVRSGSVGEIYSTKIDAERYKKEKDLIRKQKIKADDLFLLWEDKANTIVRVKDVLDFLRTFGVALADPKDDVFTFESETSDDLCIKVSRYFSNGNGGRYQVLMSLKFDKTDDTDPISISSPDPDKLADKIEKTPAYKSALGKMPQDIKVEINEQTCD